MTHRPLNAKTDWYFFVPDYSVPADCLPGLHPLTEESARQLWDEFISPAARHPMRLPDDTWPARLCSSVASTYWQDDWNNNSATTFHDWLCTMLPWSQDTPVIFTWSSAQSVATSWQVFLRCWRNFLFDDEGPFLWSLQQTQAVGFTPRGLAYAGQRCSQTTAS